MIIGKLRKKDLIINMVNKIIHQPGFEPGFERWQRPVMTATLLMFPVFWCPDPDSNRGQLPLQGSALPLSYLGRQI